MILAVFWENPAVVGLILAIPATALGYLGYRRSRGVDEAARQAGLASGHVASIGQVVDGLNSVIAAVKSDNDDLRKQVTLLRSTVDEIRARLDAVETGNVDLRAKVREQEREIAVLHLENEALKIENQKLKERISGLEKSNGL